MILAIDQGTTNTKALARSPIQRALKERPDSTELVAAARAEIEHGPVLAVRQKRLELLQERHNRLNLIVDERGADMAGVPGGKSGFLARDYKSDGREIYKVDGVLLSELREIEKQSAIETGEWQEHTAPGVMIQIVMPAVPPRGEPSEDAVIDVAVIKR